MTLDIIEQALTDERQFIESRTFFFKPIHIKIYDRNSCKINDKILSDK